MCRFMCTLGGRSEVGEIGLEAAHATSEYTVRRIWIYIVGIYYRDFASQYKA
jgi:hypothetical protein